MPHQRFHYQSLPQLQADLDAMRLDLPLHEDLSSLHQHIQIGRRNLPNRLAIHPMEACDGTLEGMPTDLTNRRYQRFAAGGASVIWLEAAAVIHEGRANPRQLYMHRDNLDAFKRMVDMMRDHAGHEIYIVVQLTHSGRYSRPDQAPAPVLAHDNPYLDNPNNKSRIITDDELDALQEHYVTAAKLAREAGFDAVDIKVCHRYLLNDLLTAHERPGKYGGSFENRSRFIIETLDKIKANADIDLAVRLNAYDEIPYPHGWGNDQNDPHIADFEEPVRLIRLLQEHGVILCNITGGNPYYNPHVNRPYNVGFYLPPTHPLLSVRKILHAGKVMKQAVPGMTVIGTGFSWLQEFAPYALAGCLDDGWFDLGGMGRMAFAYPDFARDILTDGRMYHQKCCIACGKCTEMMRNGGVAGCIIRDGALFMEKYNAGRQGKPNPVSTRIAEHI